MPASFRDLRVAVRTDGTTIDRLVAKHRCTAAYIDVGTNIGVQLRKLFEPDKYRGSLGVEIYRDAFAHDERCRVCAIGIEPSPRHTARLDELETRLQAAGAPLTVLRGAAATYDGEQQFFMHANASLDVSAHTGFAHPREMNQRRGLPDDEAHARMEMTTVRAIDLARVFKRVRADLEHVAARDASSRLTGSTASIATSRRRDAAPVIVAKIDIEAAEFEVLPYLIDSGALCGVRHLLMEWHPHVRGHGYAARVRALVNASLPSGVSSGADQLNMDGAWDGGRTPLRGEKSTRPCALPILHEVDDNSYMRDGVAWPRRGGSACDALVEQQQQTGGRISTRGHEEHLRAQRAREAVGAQLGMPVVLNLSVPTAGFCRTTSASWEGDCDHGEQGNWPFRHHPSLNSIDACVDRCRSCARCRYVSFIPRSASELGDCSWYHTCRTPSGRPSTRYEGFSTVQVKSLEA